MKEFSLGSVIVPARDGILERLGHDVAALGHRGLGLVVETRPSKALVQFPELRLALWIDQQEMADVEARSKQGDLEYSALIPSFPRPLVSGSQEKTSIVWLIWLVCRHLPVTHVLGMELGTLGSLWNEEDPPLASYTDWPVEQGAALVSLGISELVWRDWGRVEEQLGADLLFVRFLPAGMHKLELALYLRWSPSA